ncbi:death-associated protein-like 1 isoform X2 [Strix aluco]|uniref:death-associated protein-like 1 isoform X2 n=1 Tax=Strix aluco TaxID=111821 RepID=UPI003DA3A7A4
MARRRRLPPAVKAGGMRVSKKQESGPVEKNAKAPGKEKTSAVAGFSKTQNAGVLLVEVLSKLGGAKKFLLLRRSSVALTVSAVCLQR